jgi:demethoxyubiquinone hydroxylase (CLK1/Coq7/Cat5 family)
MNIEIKESLIPTLTRLADERSMTTTQYVEEYLESHLTSQYRTFVANKVANESIENVASIEEVIDTKKEEIKQVQINEKIAYDLANPVIEKQATSTDKVIK